MNKRRLQCHAWLSACIVAGLMTGCAVDRIRSRADADLASGAYEHAIESLEQGVRQYPEDAALRSRLALARAQAVADLVAKARSEEALGQFERAETDVRRAVTLGGHDIPLDGALNEVRVAHSQHDALLRARELIQAGQSVPALAVVDEALKDNPRHPELLALQAQLNSQALATQRQSGPQALAELRPISLDFRDANLRGVLDVVSRNSGLNFVLDKDVRADLRVTIFVKSVKLENALDMLLGPNQLARLTLDDKTILIYPNTPEKQREHEEQVVKVFYPANGDPKGAAAFLKAMMKIRDPYVDEHNGLVAVRDSEEAIKMAERLMEMFDHPEPEVLLDAEVLEVSTSRLTEIGINWPTSVSLTPMSLTGSTLALNSFPLNKGNFAVGIGPATAALKRVIGDVDTLANPKIRTRSHEKAHVMIGDKIPIISATTTPGTTGFVTESVTYQDVGIKLDVEPVVYPDDDVAIKLELEVSSLGTETQTAAGTVAYQISTRNASTVLRLHDGETQMLAGLISNDERTSASRVPGLGDIPILGRLFNDQSDTHNRTEIVLAITPHIVRPAPHLDSAGSKVWVGTDAAQSLKPVGGRPMVIAAPAAASSPGPSAPAASAASATPAAHP